MNNILCKRPSRSLPEVPESGGHDLQIFVSFMFFTNNNDHFFCSAGCEGAPPVASKPQNDFLRQIHGAAVSHLFHPQPLLRRTYYAFGGDLIVLYDTGEPFVGRKWYAYIRALKFTLKMAALVWMLPSWEGKSADQLSADFRCVHNLIFSFGSRSGASIMDAGLIYNEENKKGLFILPTRLQGVPHIALNTPASLFVVCHILLNPRWM